ncbi:interferon alpha/beta receptor 2-like [Enoplosus armatus]|uniref:interferon alpha/beta receptor 2-like n=1 Tax=Enoplosus armatus TaxID=215367 RepID=UPI0039935119
MGLQLLLLLHLHLVVCMSLPAPSNVTISSFNMEHALGFLPGPETPSNTRFTVEVLSFRKSSWISVAGCSELTARQTCNLNRAFKDPFIRYRARVRAFTPTQTSNWTVSGQFQPLTDTVLGPPDVSVSGCGNCLLLQLRVPTTSRLRQQQLKDLYSGVDFHVQRTRDGAQFRLHLPYKEESVIPYLQPGVEYCVAVTVNAFFNANPVSSKTYCAFTSPPQHRSSLTMVYGLLGAFCALGFLVTGLAVNGGKLSFKLLRRRLPRTLSYFLLQGQNGGSGPPEL